MKHLIVNILGGRDVGKTTIAMHAVAELRWMGISTSLNYGASKLWTDEPSIVTMNVLWRDPSTMSTHELVEMCRDTLTFLVRRSKDYVTPIGLHPSITSGRLAIDEQLENRMREGRVRYKSLPSVRASVPYIVKKICEGVGYDR
ncbi:hypothetical protein LCGC14_1771660 [marine sediment metagenome]|uniref:CobQ/CobB/MinD/ParA nucleotide binding domain-containing protein n=1 Tax=marine sediment metagenome TaxID=412755 RepID=A0A0F9GY29_9ZZZZ